MHTNTVLCLYYPAAALAKAVRSRPDLHFGLYFSQYEWFNPLYLQDKANNYTTQSYVKVRITSQTLFLPPLVQLVHDS